MFYAVAYENGTYKTFSNWKEAELTLKGKEVRCKKFPRLEMAETWGAALAAWFNKRKSVKAVLDFENSVENDILKHDPRVVPLPI